MYIIFCITYIIFSFCNKNALKQGPMVSV